MRSLLLLTPLIAVSQAALTKIANFGSNPTKLEMNLYIPTNVIPDPPLVVVLHYCSANPNTLYTSTKYASLADKSGFIVLYPGTTHDSNCWDVGSAKSLTRDGGGDTTGIANMIRYTVARYGADPKRVFVTGQSSGGMMVNTLCAVYPDLFAACSAYSGVAAGCLAGSTGFSPTSADPKCANGQVKKSGEQWAQQVKSFHEDYQGEYPRFMAWHGAADTFVTYANLAEVTKEWSALHNVQFVKNVTNSPENRYTQMVYGDGHKLVAYSAQGVAHPVPAHENVDMDWFGLAGGLGL